MRAPSDHPRGQRLHAVSIIRDSLKRDTFTKQVIGDASLEASSLNFTVSLTKDTACMLRRQNERLLRSTDRKERGEEGNLRGVEADRQRDDLPRAQVGKRKKGEKEVKGSHYSPRCGKVIRERCVVSLRWSETEDWEPCHALDGANYKRAMFPKKGR